MKIRSGYVSNSSNSSFVATGLISLDSFKEIVKEAVFNFLCEEYKRSWKVSSLTKGQLSRVKKALYNCGYWRELQFGKFEYSKHMADHWPHLDIPIKSLRGNPSVSGDDYYLGALITYIEQKSPGVYTFWG